MGLGEMVTLLIEAKADVNWRDDRGNGRRSALWSTLRQTKELLVDAIDRIRQKRILQDIHSKSEGDLYTDLDDSDEDSLLHAALAGLDLGLLEKLLEAGATDPSIPNIDAQGMVEWYFRLGPDGEQKAKGGTVFSF